MIANEIRSRTRIAWSSSAIARLSLRCVFEASLTTHRQLDEQDRQQHEGDRELDERETGLPTSLLHLMKSASMVYDLVGPGSEAALPLEAHGDRQEDVVQGMVFVVDDAVAAEVARHTPVFRDEVLA